MSKQWLYLVVKDRGGRGGGGRDGGDGRCKGTCSRNSRKRERPSLFNGEWGFIYMKAAELRNVDASTRSGLSSGTGDTQHVKDKRRNEGITREPRKREKG